MSRSGCYLEPPSTKMKLVQLKSNRRISFTSLVVSFMHFSFSKAPIFRLCLIVVVVA